MSALPLPQGEGGAGALSAAVAVAPLSPASWTTPARSAPNPALPLHFLRESSGVSRGGV